MANIIARYAQKLNPKLFLSYFKEHSQKLVESPTDDSAKQSLQNLIQNYKQNHTHYCQEPNLLNRLAFWYNKANIIDDDFRNLIENHKKASGEEEKSKISKEILASRAKFIAEYASTPLIEPAKIDKEKASDLSIKHISEQEFYNAVMLANDYEQLRQVELQLQELIKNSNNCQKLYPGIYAMCQKGFELDKITRDQIWDKIINTNFTSLNDLSSALKIINHRYFFYQPSESSWKKFELMILSNSDSWNPALTMKSLADRTLHSPLLFQKLIERWINFVDIENNYDNFSDGFYALAKTDFLNSQLLEWCNIHTKKHALNFDLNDILIILRGLIYHESYCLDTWSILLTQMFSNMYEKSSLFDQKQLNHIYKSIKIDKPQGYEELLLRFEAYKDDLFNGFKFNQTHTVSSAEKNVGRKLRSLGFDFTRSVIIDNIYEADFVLNGKHIIIESFGRPFHTNQYDSGIDMKTRLKLRHLKRLGWKVIAIFSNNGLERRLKKIIPMIEKFEDPKCAYIFDSKVKII